MTAPVLLDNPLNVEGIMKKLMEFNKLQAWICCLTAPAHSQWLNKNPIQKNYPIKWPTILGARFTFLVTEKIILTTSGRTFARYGYEVGSASLDCKENIHCGLD